MICTQAESFLILFHLSSLDKFGTAWSFPSPVPETLRTKTGVSFVQPHMRANGSERGVYNSNKPSGKGNNFNRF